MMKPNYQKGIAILFAVLLVSIVLTVSLTLFNITYRALVLSSLARESQFSFYAADSGRACARYYDSLASPPFGFFYIDSSTNLAFLQPAGVIGASACGASVIAGPLPSCTTPPGPGVPPCISSFVITLSDGATPTPKTNCAKVTVSKGLDTNSPPTSCPVGVSCPENAIGKTKIEAFGYNNYDSNYPTAVAGNSNAPCYQATDRTVERASKMVY